MPVLSLAVGSFAGCLLLPISRSTAASHTTVTCPYAVALASRCAVRGSAIVSRSGCRRAILELLLSYHGRDVARLAGTRYEIAVICHTAFTFCFRERALPT